MSKINLLFFLISPIIFLACTGDTKIRKSAIHYFEDGNTALMQRDYHMAVWNFQKAIKLDSDSPNFHYNLGLVYFEIGNYSESIESFKRVENLVPNQSDTYYNLALAHYKMSNSRMADIYYNRYQDLLSLRKAKERLEEIKKKQEMESNLPKSESKTKLKNENSSIRNKNTQKNTDILKIPNWEK